MSTSGADFVLMIAASAALGIGIASLREIDHLKRRVSCLEHPHGASSIAATRINGRFVVTQPAHRTGCP